MCTGDRVSTVGGQQRTAEGSTGAPPTGRTAVITLRGLTKRYGTTVAVDGLTLDVAEGRVTGFLGPNGAGKSTTMRMILGLDHPPPGRRSSAAGRTPPCVTRYVWWARCWTPGPCTRPLGAQPSAGAGAQQRHPGTPGGRGARRGRADHGGTAAHQGVLARHVPAARHRRCPAGRPRSAGPGRAGERPRSRRGALGKGVGPRAGGPGADRPALQPSDERDAAHRRPARRHRPGAPAGGQPDGIPPRGELTAFGTRTGAAPRGPPHPADPSRR